MERSSPKEFYLDMSAAMVECLKEAGLPPGTIVKLVAMLTASICRRFAGSTCYFPKNTVEKAAQRAAAIVVEFNGSNHRELAIKHDVSMNRVYQLVKRAGIKMNAQKGA